MTDAQLLAAIKRYREAYFAYELWNMRSHRDYERARRRTSESMTGWDADGTRDAECRRLRTALDDAKYELVKGPPAEYTALRKAMIREFGD